MPVFLTLLFIAVTARADEPVLFSHQDINRVIGEIQSSHSNRLKTTEAHNAKLESAITALYETFSIVDKDVGVDSRRKYAALSKLSEFSSNELVRLAKDPKHRLKATLEKIASRSGYPNVRELAGTLLNQIDFTEEKKIARRPGLESIDTVGLRDHGEKIEALAKLWEKAATEVCLSVEKIAERRGFLANKKSNRASELRDLRSSVGRNDETLASLRADKMKAEKSLAGLRAHHEAATKKVTELTDRKEAYWTESQKQLSASEVVRLESDLSEKLDAIFVWEGIRERDNASIANLFPAEWIVKGQTTAALKDFAKAWKVQMPDKQKDIAWSDFTADGLKAFCKALTGAETHPRFDEFKNGYRLAEFKPAGLAALIEILEKPAVVKQMALGAKIDAIYSKMYGDIAKAEDQVFELKYAAERAAEEIKRSEQSTRVATEAGKALSDSIAAKVAEAQVDQSESDLLDRCEARVVTAGGLLHVAKRLGSQGKIPLDIAAALYRQNLKEGGATHR